MFAQENRNNLYNKKLSAFFYFKTQNQLIIYTCEPLTLVMDLKLLKQSRYPTCQICQSWAKEKDFWMEKSKTDFSFGH